MLWEMSASHIEESQDVTSQDLDEKLDLLSLQCLFLMNQVISMKVDIERRMKEGTGMLAKARYVMGGSSVSTLQIPSEEAGMTASTLSSFEESERMIGKSLRLKYYNFRVFPSAKVKDDTEDEVKDGIEQKLSNLQLDPRQSQASNPLRWFGVLVPNSLREAQKIFGGVLLLCAECSSIESELEAVIREIDILNQVKSNRQQK
ncbi:unnamed protein product [Darwinula stevensoni]|uniref:Vacuolar ATPase assembly protein VMA22 n=1 Tax=Darwinula stevensoni TaxID=69355 RepID=A0A7R8X748_9CRUS|nr:unnamed protein product [Darwinula stevensoni]CAG0881926.1 unnamed protein product [Darwinula stevensoni]